MASVEKFAQSTGVIVNQLRHIERTIKNPSNEDIDFAESGKNYSLIPDRGISSYSYYKKRKAELYCYNRADVKTMAGWIVTAPRDLPEEEQDNFFQKTYNFLCERYGGEKNVVQAVVHKDESGQPHLHFCFIPVVPDKKHGGEKICACQVLNRNELRDFHPALQKYLTENGVNAKVISGITKAQGGNKTVREMKQERKWEQEYSNTIGASW